MRVVAGSVGGIPLSSPKTLARPTMDRVKAAIFSSLADRVSGARVLDLFAGSGSLGIEALSRGAAAATFVEQDPRAADCIRRNLEATRLTGDIRRMDVFRFVKQSAPGCFDMVFADPPYAKDTGDIDHAADLLALPELRALLADDALFILERAPVESTPGEPWEVIRSRRYGATEILFLATASGGDS